jgi:hypothetical protein
MTSVSSSCVYRISIPITYLQCTPKCCISHSMAKALDVADLPWLRKNLESIFSLGTYISLFATGLSDSRSIGRRQLKHHRSILCDSLRASGMTGS